MSKARDIANILSANTAIATDAEVSSAVSAAVSTHATAANGHVGRGTTLNRPLSPSIGDLYFDTTLNALIAYRVAGWEKVSTDPAPQVASILPTTSAISGTVITISGSNFKPGLTVQFIGTNLISYNSPTATFIDVTSATATTPVLPVAYEPYDIRVVNPDGQFGLLENSLDAGGTPIWNTASGNIANIYEGTQLNVSVSATDPDGTSIIYSSSDLPIWISINSSTGLLTGTAPQILSDTTYSFTVTASDGVNTSSRSFNVVVSNVVAPSSVEYFLIGGGASGAKGTPGACYGAGGGAGGYYTGTVAVTPGTQYTFTVGAGGVGSTATNSKQNGFPTSAFGFTGGGGLGGFSGPGTTGSGGVSGSPQNNPGVSYTVQNSSGGGGAGGNGNVPSGGVGIASSITGTTLYYGGGGGGSGDGTIGLGGSGIGGNGANAGGTPTSGAANTGSGGGSMRGDDAPPAGNGGSGVIIVAYPDSYLNISSISAGLTYTLDTIGRPGYKVYKFTAGSGTVTF
jgi:hypothetical protein